MNRGAMDLQIPHIEAKHRRPKEEETHQLACQFLADADELAEEQADILLIHICQGLCRDGTGKPLKTPDRSRVQIDPSHW